ncbi:MAG: cellulose biosynthesis protein BcsS [Rhodomicrobium sp.]|nr:cellulose biosynthesis protein BcsS [Rhodomicrobium sp.]
MTLLSKFDLPEGRGEFSNGFDVTGNAWSAYSSAVIALTGPSHRDGWRLKLSGYYSSYGYDTRDNTVCRKIHDVGHTDPNETLSRICNEIAGKTPEAIPQATHDFLASNGLAIEGDQIVAITAHRGEKYFGGAAPGYQATLGALILKTYLGLGYEQQDVTPSDASKSLQGSYWGAQGWIEAWLPLGPDGWISADGSYFTGTSSYSAAMKLGYRPVDWLTLGPELAAYGDRDDASGRAGGFLRFDVKGVETTIAGAFPALIRTMPALTGP